MGHEVSILTSHHDVDHCFEETSQNGTILKLGIIIFLNPTSGHLHPNIQVIGGWIPHNFYGKFTAFFAILRMCYIVIHLLCHPQNYPECIFIDGLSAPVPMIYFANIPILFYCHFPDMVRFMSSSRYFDSFYCLLSSIHLLFVIIPPSGAIYSMFVTWFPSSYFAPREPHFSSEFIACVSTH
jgi:hypothetical protein